MGWLLTGLIALGAALAAAGAMHSYDSAQHRAEIATMQAQAATTLADAQAQARATEQAALTKLTEQEDAYAKLAETTRAAQDQGRRLSADLTAATTRLRGLTRSAGGSGSGLSIGATSPDGCADLRAALDRAVGAVERLQSGGDRVAELGQTAVDVATIAAQTAHE